MRGDDEVFMLMAVVPRGVEPDEYTQTQIENVFATFHPRFGE